SVATVDHRVGEDIPLHWGLRGNYSRFYRIAPSFDPIYPLGFTPATPNQFIPGQTPLRRAQRLNLVPELHYTARVLDVFEVIPSVQYRTFYYTFDQPLASPLARGYLVAQTEVGTTFENLYGDRIKHKLRPSLTY